jgi:hypothetical protein
MEKVFKIRCSAISNIMAGEVGLTDVQESRLNELLLRRNGTGKPLTDNMNVELDKLIYKKDNPELPQGAKTYCKNWLKKALFFRDDNWKSIVIDKGLMCEFDGIKLINEVYNVNVEKNDEYFSNEFIQGSPDVLQGSELVRDIKSSWDLFTFPMFDDELPKPEYWWQLQGYMLLTGIKKASLDYVLIDTPMPLVDLDLKKLYYQSGGVAADWTPEHYESYYPNYRFDDIPKEKRVKSFVFDLENGIEEKIIERVEMCRKYIDTLLKN